MSKSYCLWCGCDLPPHADDSAMCIDCGMNWIRHVDPIIKGLDHALAVATELAEALTETEWVMDYALEEKFCPMCEEEEGFHEPHCKLQKALHGD